MREDISYWVLKLTGQDEWTGKPYKPEYLKLPSSVSYDTAFKIIYQIIIAYKKEMIEQGVFHQLSLITMSQIVLLLCKTYGYEVLDRGKFNEKDDSSNNRIKLFSLDWFYEVKSMIRDDLFTYEKILYKNIIRYNRSQMTFTLYEQDEEVAVEKFNSTKILEHKDVLVKILDKSIDRKFMARENFFVITKNKTTKNYKSVIGSDHRIIYQSTNFLCEGWGDCDWGDIDYLLEDILHVYDYNFPEKLKDITLDSLCYLMEKLCNIATIDMSKKLDDNIIKNSYKEMVYLDIETLIKNVRGFKEHGPARGCIFFKDDKDVIREIKAFHGYE